MTRPLRPIAVLALALALAACFGPSERRPGMHLPGPVVATLPTDWSLTDAEKEIAIEVRGPLGLPHSVTIWCVSLDGALYLGARDPATKRWPGWADRDPDVRLGIAGRVYEVHLAPLDDVATVERVRTAYGAKYALPAPPAGAPVPPVRYWRVEPRS